MWGGGDEAIVWVFPTIPILPNKPMREGGMWSHHSPSNYPYTPSQPMRRGVRKRGYMFLMNQSIPLPDWSSTIAPLPFSFPLGSFLSFSVYLPLFLFADSLLFLAGNLTLVDVRGRLGRLWGCVWCVCMSMCLCVGALLPGWLVVGWHNRGGGSAYGSCSSNWSSGKGFLAGYRIGTGPAVCLSWLSCHIGEWIPWRNKKK